MSEMINPTDTPIATNPDTSTISSKWLWWQALIPFICTAILVGFGLGSTTQAEAFFAISFLLGYEDVKSLNKAGVDWEGRSLLTLFAVVAPVYAFVRLAKTSRKFLPAIVSCVLFVCALGIMGLSVLKETVDGDEFVESEDENGAELTPFGQKSVETFKVQIEGSLDAKNGISITKCRIVAVEK